jgi:hypothetical protein
MKTRTVSFIATLVVLIAFYGSSAFVLPDATARAAVADDDLAGRLKSLQVPFIVNQGQAHPDVCFYAHTFGGTLFVTHSGDMVYSLPAGRGPNPAGVVIQETLVNPSANPPRGAQRSPTRVNYFKGEDPQRWRTNVPTYAAVAMGEVYPGIHLLLQAHGHNVEKVFRVAPGGSPDNIRLRITGADRMHVNTEGELVLTTALGSSASPGRRLTSLSTATAKILTCNTRSTKRLTGFN